MNNNMLSLSDEVIGKIIRELYTEYEINLRNMFNDSTTELLISPRLVVDVLHRHGLEEYASQIYILFGGLYAGCAGQVGNVLHEVNTWVAAYRMANELDVNVSEVDLEKALEYYGNKG